MNRGSLPLNALRAFESAARLGSMGRAAAELGVTHSAISRQIRGLEARLGIPLFEGPRNRLTPSAAAARLLPPLTEAFDGIEAAVSRTAGQGRRSLDVSCLGTLTMRWLIPRLYGFQRRHPGIEVRLSADDGPVEFRRGGPDLAIRVGRDWPGARVTPLFEDRTGPVLAPALMPEGGLAGPADLARLPALHNDTRPGAWPDWCRLMGIAPPRSSRGFEHFYFLLEAATAGLGVAIAPEVLVRDDLKAGRLAAPFGFRPTGMIYAALTPPEAGPDTKAFLDWLTEQAREEA